VNIHEANKLGVTLDDWRAKRHIEGYAYCLCEKCQNSPAQASKRRIQWYKDTAYTMCYYAAVYGGEAAIGELREREGWRHIEKVLENWPQKDFEVVNEYVGNGMMVIDINQAYGIFVGALEPYFKVLREESINSISEEYIRKHPLELPTDTDENETNLTRAFTSKPEVPALPAPMPQNNSEQISKENLEEAAYRWNNGANSIRKLAKAMDCSKWAAERLVEALRYAEVIPALEPAVVQEAPVVPAPVAVTPIKAKDENRDSLFDSLRRIRNGNGNGNGLKR